MSLFEETFDSRLLSVFLPFQRCKRERHLSRAYPSKRSTDFILSNTEILIEPWLMPIHVLLFKEKSSSSIPNKLRRGLIPLNCNRQELKFVVISFFYQGVEKQALQTTGLSHFGLPD